MDISFQVVNLDLVRIFQDGDLIGEIQRFRSMEGKRVWHIHLSEDCRGAVRVTDWRRLRAAAIAHVEGLDC